MNEDWFAKEVCLSEAPTPMQSLSTTDKRGLELFLWTMQEPPDCYDAILVKALDSISVIE